MRLLEKRTEVYTLLHRSEFKKSAQFRQILSHVCSHIFKTQILFAIMAFTDVDGKFLQRSAFFTERLQNNKISDLIS